MMRRWKDEVTLVDTFRVKDIIYDWKWVSGPAITGFTEDGSPITTSVIVAKKSFVMKDYVEVYAKTKNDSIYMLALRIRN